MTHAGYPALFREFGEECVFYTGAGLQLTLSCIVDEQPDRQSEGADAYEHQPIDVKVRKADGYTPSLHQDHVVVTRLGHRYTVTYVLEETEGAYVLHCTP